MEQNPTNPANPANTAFQFPSEEVTLPSKGILYPEGHPLKSGVIEMKYMTDR